MTDNPRDDVAPITLSEHSRLLIASHRAMRADGNGVDIDTESAAMAKNGLEYEALVSVAKARIQIVQSALGVG